MMSSWRYVTLLNGGRSFLNILYFMFCITGIIAISFSLLVVLTWLGALGMLGTSYATSVTMRENPFISRWARIQDDGGKQLFPILVCTPSHVYCNHSLYSFSGTPAGFDMGALPAGMVILVYLICTHLEDRMM